MEDINMGLKLTENTEVAKKLLSALNVIAKEDFSVSDDTILDKMYVYLENFKDAKEILSSCQVEAVKWIERILKEWDKDNIFYDVKKFAVRFIGLIGSFSEGFNVLKSGICLNNFQDLLKSVMVQNDMSILVPSILSLKMMLRNVNGLKWIIDSRLWETVVNAGYNGKSIYVKRCCVEFLSDFLLRSSEHHTGTCREVFTMIAKPLLETNGMCLRTKDAQRDQNLEIVCGSAPDKINSSHILTSANFLSDLLEFMISNKTFDQLSFVLIINQDKFMEIMAMDCYNSTQALETFSKLAFFIHKSQYLHNPCLASNSMTKPLKMMKVFLNKKKWSCVVSHWVRFLSTNYMLDTVCRCLACSDWETIVILILMASVSPERQLKSPTITRVKRKMKIIYDEVYDLKSSSSIDDNDDETCVEDNNSNHDQSNLQDANQIPNNNIIPDENNIREENVQNERQNQDENQIEIPNGGRNHVQNQINIQDDNNVENIKDVRTKKRIRLYYHSKEFQTRKKERLFMAIPSILGLLKISNYLKHDESMHTLHYLLCIVLDELSTVDEKLSSLCINILTTIGKFVEECPIDTQRKCKTILKVLQSTVFRILNGHDKDIRFTVTSLQVLKQVTKKHGFHSAVTSLPEIVVDPGVWKSRFFSEEEMQTLVSKLSSDNWEVRDSVLELLETILECTSTGFGELSGCAFDDALFSRILKMAIEDTSSYVRASSLRFFAKCWTFLSSQVLVCCPSLYETAIKSVQKDDMPVVRRAACELITAMYISNSMNLDKKKLCETMLSVISKDLDWEVKMLSLQFWKCVITKSMVENNIPLDPSCLYFLPKTKEDVANEIVTLLNNLGEIGLFQAIWIGLNDECDIKVSEEAYSLVTQIEELNAKWGFITLIQKTEEQANSEDSCNPHLKMDSKRFFTSIREEDWKENLNARKNWIENACDDLNSILDHILNVDNRIDDWDHNVVDCD